MNIEKRLSLATVSTAIPSATSQEEAMITIIYLFVCISNSVGKVVHGSDGPAGRVGSRFCQILAGQVSTSDFFSFLLIISWYLNRYESSNTKFGFIDFLRYLLYNYYNN